VRAHVVGLDFEHAPEGFLSGGKVTVI